MPPQLVLIRHAQAQHNVDRDYSIPDPALTDLGREQCAALRASLRQRFGDAAAADVAVVVSPMRRTLQTAELALDWLAERGVVFEASADWQENSDKPCDTGSALSSLPPFPHADLSGVDPVWPDKTSAAAGRYHARRGAILARGAAALAALRRRPERLVFVVSHSGFLRLAVAGRWFFNADWRLFRFAVAEADVVDRRLLLQGHVLEQDESTLAGGLGLSWTDAVEIGSEMEEDDDDDQGSEAAAEAVNEAAVP